MDCVTDFINWGAAHHNPNEYYPFEEQPWNNILNHLIVIVGWYDDVNIPQGGYWICKNSWGTDWGYDGFFNVEYGSMFTGTFISWVSCELQGENSPPEKPSKPIGSTTGKIDEIYTYTTSTSDPNTHDMIYYLFDWGDGTNSSWIGPYSTGDICNTSHHWSSKGSYNVKVQAKDNHDSVSDWSDPLSISMPKIHSYDQTMQLFLKKMECFSFI